MIECSINLDSKEYWDFRKGKIGASDAPIIMNDSPWKTPYQLWKEKLSDEERIVHPWMQRGIDLEPVARARAEQELNMKIESGIVVLHPKYQDILMASLDGYCREHNIIFEIKCPGKEDHFSAKQGLIPKKYIAQLQHQLACIPQAKYSYYVSFSGEDIIFIKVERDKSYIEKLIEKELAFFKCMQDITPPELLLSDKLKRYDAEWIALSDDCLALMNHIEVLKTELEFKKEELITLCQGKSTQGGGISLDFVVQKGLINYKSIPELKEIDLDKYRGESKSYWKLSKNKGDYNGDSARNVPKGTD